MPTYACVNRIRRRAEVSSYFERHDEAESMFREIDRKDLTISLRERLGDWFRVVQVTGREYQTDSWCFRRKNCITFHAMIMSCCSVGMTVFENYLFLVQVP